MGYQDIENVYPNMAVDTYPDIVRSPADQPMGDARTVASDPTFITGWGADNIVSDPTRGKSVEDLQAQGLGTLRARPLIDQTVDAAGLYRANTYRVVLRRALKPTGKGNGAVKLRPGTTVPVAFAVWNGSSGDRDGKKSITIWQDLKLAP